MAKGNKKSGPGVVVGGVSGSSRHLFGAAKGVHGPGKGEHAPGKGMAHKAHTHGRGHRITTRGGPDK